MVWPRAAIPGQYLARGPGPVVLIVDHLADSLNVIYSNISSSRNHAETCFFITHWDWRCEHQDQTFSENLSGRDQFHPIQPSAIYLSWLHRSSYEEKEAGPTLRYCLPLRLNSEHPIETVWYSLFQRFPQTCREFYHQNWPKRNSLRIEGPSVGGFDSRERTVCELDRRPI